MVKPAKIELLSEIKEDFADAKLAIIADYRGLDVEKLTDLRRKLNAESAKFRVVKNTFMKKVGDDLGWNEIDSMLKGPTAVAYAPEASAPAAKVLRDFAKANKELNIKGGVLEGCAISEQEVERLAALPSKEQLISQLLSVMQGPMRNLVSVLSAPMRDVVLTMKALADDKAKN